jgi:hypothetical protein
MLAFTAPPGKTLIPLNRAFETSITEFARRRMTRTRNWLFLQMLLLSRSFLHNPLSRKIGAGEGNRTLVIIQAG